MKMLTDEKIRYIAKKVAEECNKSPDNISVREIKKAIKEVDTAIENLWKGIEQGQAVDMLTERLHQRQAEKAELETQLANENNKKICLSEAQILAFLDYVCEMPLDDFNKRRAIINIFVHSIYLYDDHFTLIVNASKKPLSIENIPLDDIEEAFEGENSDMEGCSSLMTPAPPITKRRTCGVFAYFPCISRFAAILILSQNKKYLHKRQYFCPKDSTNIKMQHEMQHETGKNCGYAFCRRFACGAGIACGKTGVACGAGIAYGKTGLPAAKRGLPAAKRFGQAAKLRKGEKMRTYPLDARALLC